jgi:hypothetical protein
MNRNSTSAASGAGGLARGNITVTNYITAPYASEEAWLQDIVTKAVLKAIGNNHRGAFSDFDPLVGETAAANTAPGWRPLAW